MLRKLPQPLSCLGQIKFPLDPIWTSTHINDGEFRPIGLKFGKRDQFYVNNYLSNFYVNRSHIEPIEPILDLFGDPWAIKSYDSKVKFGTKNMFSSRTEMFSFWLRHVGKQNSASLTLVLVSPLNFTRVYSTVADLCVTWGPKKEGEKKKKNNF